MKQRTNIRLLIVDDHPVVRAGLRYGLQKARGIVLVGEAANTEEACAAVAASQPDLVLIDIRLRQESGIELCRRLKSEHPALRAVFFTAHLEEDLVVRGLEAGADGYLLKDGDMNKLQSALREVMDGGTVLDREVTQHLIRLKSHLPASQAAGWESLTDKEARLLAEVAQGRTDKQAAAALGVSFKTARNYLDRIFAKLGVHNRTEAALIYMRQQGAEGVPPRSGRNP